MKHFPERLNYAVRTLARNPSETPRLLRTAWATFLCRHLKRCIGPRTVIGERVVLINSSNIRIGADCGIQDRVYIRAGIEGSVQIGDGAAVNSFVQIYGHGGVVIGPHAQIGPNAIVTTTGHDYAARELESNFSPVRIGERAWIGANAIILPGVTIGDRSVIGAGAVVTGDIPPDSVAVGIPARVVKTVASRADAG